MTENVKGLIVDETRDSKTILIECMLGDYFNFFEPQAQKTKNGEDRDAVYTANFLIDRSTEQGDKLAKAFRRQFYSWFLPFMNAEKPSDLPDSVMSKIPVKSGANVLKAKRQYALDNDKSWDNDAVKDEDHIFHLMNKSDVIITKVKAKIGAPVVVDENNRELSALQKNKLYAGLKGQAIFTYSQYDFVDDEKQKRKGANFTLAGFKILEETKKYKTPNGRLKPSDITSRFFAVDTSASSKGGSDELGADDGFDGDFDE